MFVGAVVSTLRKWHRGYLQEGEIGLIDKSRKPHFSPNQKITEQHIHWIVELRNKRNLGARRIQSELVRLHQCFLSLATIHKVLVSQKVKAIKKLKRKKQFIRDNRPVPGDRIQIDTCKIAPGIYQYTAVDDCSYWRVLELYTPRTAANTLAFIEVMVEQFPFPIQRIQSDRGREFFAIAVQEKLMEYSIKFRPNKPGSPHLNGKVERSQKTDLEEFYATADLSNFALLKDELKCWQFFYNWQRPHGSLAGKTPSQFSSELGKVTPFWDEVIATYQTKKERIQEQNYQLDLAIKKLKGSL